MSTASAPEFSALVQRINAGERSARDQLFSLAYDDLRKLARSRLRSQGPGADMGATTLVHESYLRMMASAALRSDDRRAFFAYASRVMRSVIVDAVREHQAERRGGHLEQLTLDTGVAESMPAGEAQLLQVHEALETLARSEPRLAQVVEMRYFGGYTETEVAQALGLTERTVRRDWDKARLLLMVLLRD